jgi:cytidylate kinase
LEKVAEKLHKPTRIMVDIDEKQRSVIMDIVQNMFNPDYVSDDQYFRNLCQVVYSITQVGGAVIVGRGANFIAPKSYGLQVQIVAPYKVRVARTVQYEQISYSKARDAIRHLSDERAAFVKQYFGKDVSGSKYYDMTLNTTYYTIQGAARLIIDAYKAKFPKGKLTERPY